MDDLDREQFLTRRLPKPDNDRGPTAQWAAYCADLDARVHNLPVPSTEPVEHAEAEAS